MECVPVYVFNSNMKRNLLFLIISLVSLSCFAQGGSTVNSTSNNVTPTKAKAIAAKFLKCDAPVEVELNEVFATRMTNRVKGKESFPAFYIYNKGVADGFAIVAGDSRFPSVLGYSDSGSFPTDGNMSPALVSYLDFCAQYISDVRSGDADAPRKASSTSGTPVVEPLLKTKWGQEAPYNLMCPKVGNENSYVGCVATAMAQIMKFWNWPAHGRSYISYSDSDFGTLSVDFEQSSYDWANMYNNAMQNSKSQARKDAVAKLSYDCGIASRMQYSTEGSGTTLILARLGLGRYLGYAASKMTYLNRACYGGSQESYNHIIYSELNAGRPILYGALSSKGGGKDAGHCFVFDGYDSDGFVHVNWGWNGSGDGYYAITVLDPDGTKYEFTDSHDMVYGIQPDTDWNDSKEDQVPMFMNEKQTLNVSSVSLGVAFTDTIHSIFNKSGNQRSYLVSVALCDLDENIVEIVGSMNNGERIAFPYLSGYSSYDVKCVIPSTVKDGKYGLRVICKEYSSTNSYDWILPATVGGYINDWLPVEIKGGKATFNPSGTPIIPNDIESVDVETTSKFYYDLQGRKLSSPTKGSIIIKKERMSDGTTKTTKMIAN